MSYSPPWYENRINKPSLAPCHKVDGGAHTGITLPNITGYVSIHGKVKQCGYRINGDHTFDLVHVDGWRVPNGVAQKLATIPQGVVNFREEMRTRAKSGDKKAQKCLDEVL